MKGAKGMKKEGSFDVEEWKQELKKAAEGDYYHPDGDGLVPSLLNDVNTLEVDAIGAIMDLDYERSRCCRKWSRQGSKSDRNSFP
ncbi:unnamed protein product [Ascophyllum nodosum]